MPSRISSLLALAFLGLIETASAAEILGGAGIPYTARLVFQKVDALNSAPTVMVKTGDALIPSPQENSKVSPLLVSTVKSRGWCDPQASPNTTRPDASECYGWSMYTQWFLIDLSKLHAQKTKTIWVQLSARPYDDRDGEADDDLVPALTVWRGQQTQGRFGDWYPNRFQGYNAAGQPNPGTKPFWAWTLAPLSNAAKGPSWSSAREEGRSTASVVQKITLQGGDKDLLTVAVAGDDRGDAPLRNVNFKLLARISTTPPAGEMTEPKDGSKSGGFDTYGCSVGVTCWHPPMNHCMDVPLCELPEYLGECLLCTAPKKAALLPF